MLVASNVVYINKCISVEECILVPVRDGYYVLQRTAKNSDSL